ncbi:hypothetical protein MHH52_22770 [Paenibacillus sp. FSL K6-0276]
MSRYQSCVPSIDDTSVEICQHMPLTIRPDPGPQHWIMHYSDVVIT